MRRFLAVWLSLASISEVFGQTVTSTFTTGTDGWTAPGASGGAINWITTGGNPGGFVSATDPVAAAAPVFWSFAAPVAYKGNITAYYNGTFTFDLQQGLTRTAVQQPDMTIQSGSFVLYYFSPTPPYPAVTPGWSSYKVEINELSGNWKTGGSTTAPAATASDFASVMATVSTITIRGRYGSVPATLTTGGLDNVVMQQFYVSTQPIGQTVCDGTIVSLTSVGTGIGTMTYQWQKFNAATGGWNNLSNGGGYSNVTTSTMSVNTTGNFGAGSYRARVSRSGANDIFSNSATVVINALPAAPGTSGNSACGPSTVTVNATGGSAGQYRWYTVPSGGSPISGQTASAYSAFISATTTYYAAINNGTCESARTAVTATINSLPTAPTTVGGSSCGPGTISLSASGGTAGQFRWYTTPTGGTAIAGQINSSFTTPLINTSTTYYVSINNGTCESPRSPVVAAVNSCPPNQPPVIASATATTTIGGTTSVNLVPLITDPDNNVNLGSLKVKTPPISGALATIDATYNLRIDYNNVRFAGEDKLSIEACDLLNSCAQQSITVEVSGDIIIYNGFSPNADGKNDTWTIQNIETIAETRSNHVSLFNRWGDMVFETEDYDNSSHVFTGIGKNGAELPPGTYYYNIEFTSGRPPITGYVALKR